MVTSDVRASLQTLIEAIQAVINDSAGGELEGDYAGCVAVSMDLIGTMEDALSALIAEGPSQQDDGVEQRADEAFRELATYKEDAEDTEAAPRSAQATAESEKAK